jgi:hypothetical protein
VRKVPSIPSCLTILLSLSLTHCGGEEPGLNDTDDGVIDNDQDGVVATADGDEQSTCAGDCDGHLNSAENRDSLDTASRTLGHPKGGVLIVTLGR